VEFRLLGPVEVRDGDARIPLGVPKQCWPSCCSTPTRIEGAHLRRHWKTTRQDARNTAAPDLVDRKFTAQAPNRLWVADFSYIFTMQGVLYLATVLDVFSRKIVGWQMSDRMTTDLVLSAFEMALWRRHVVRQQLVQTTSVVMTG